MLMKRKQLQKLQNLQDAYSALCGLTIMITDQGDNRLTVPSGLSEIVSLLLGNHRLPIEDSILRIIHKVKGIHKPIVYETTRGFKLLVVPIKNKERTLYYIFAGVIVDQSAKDLIARRLSEDAPEYEPETWRRALNSTPTYGQERMEAILNQLEELGEMIKVLLEREGEADKYASQLQLLNLLHLMDCGVPSWLQGVLGVFVRVMELEFAGFARKTKGEQFTVTETVGFNEDASVQGASFFIGEGFLGQVGLTKQMGYWERSDRDPRVSFFTTRGIDPKAIICYPIKYKDQLFGLLFGGDSLKQELSEEIADMGALLANRLATDFYSLESEDFYERSRVRMEVLKDMSRGVLEIKEKESFFQILIESIQRTVQTSFICLVLNKQGEEGMSLYASPNRSKDLYSAYADNITTTYFGEGRAGFSMFRKPALRDWNGLELIELPLVIEQRLLGVMGLHFDSEVKHKEYLPFLNAINGIVITKLQLATQATPLSKTNDVALLHQTLLFWKPDAYYKAMKIKELAQGFLKQLNGSLEDIEWIGQASLLTEYEPELLLSWIGETAAVGLLREVSRYRLGESKNEDIGTESCILIGKVLFIVIWYCEYGEKEWLLTLPFSLEEPLKRSFEYFLSTRTELVAGTQLQRPLESKGHFTPREQEILNLVLQGLNNFEIAKKLFISTHTVKNHVTKIYEKLGVIDRAQAIAKMYQSALNAPTQKR
jgi:DNA-binding CsgD family transcriptional regulator